MEIQQLEDERKILINKGEQAAKQIVNHKFKIVALKKMGQIEEVKKSLIALEKEKIKLQGILDEIIQINNLKIKSIKRQIAGNQQPQN
jgi:hypothetical protein